MKRRFCLVLLLSFFTFQGSALPQGNAEKGSRRKADSFFSYLPPDRVNLVYAGDAYDLVERFLRSNAFRKAVEKAAPSSQAGKGLLAGSSLVAARLKSMPRETVLAWSSRTSKGILNFIKVYLLFGLLDSARALPQDEGRDLQKKLKDELRKVFEDFPLPGISLMLRFRTGWDSWKVFQQVKEALSLGARELGMSPLVTRTSLALTLKFTDFLETVNAQAIRRICGDDPEGRALTEAILELKLSFWVDWKKEVLLFTVGTPLQPGGKRMDPSRLGPMWEKGKNPLFFGRWDLREGKEALDEIVTLWRRWEKTPVGESFLGNMEETFSMQMEVMGKGLSSLPVEGTLRVDAPGDLVGVYKEEGVKKGCLLRESPLSLLVPPDSPFFYASAADSLGGTFLSLLRRIDSRIEKDALLAEFSGKGDPEAIEKRNVGIRRLLKPLSLHIHDSMEKVFLPSWGLLLDTWTEPGLKVDGNPVDWVELPRVAVLGRVTSPESFLEFARKTFLIFLEHFYPERKKDLEKEKFFVKTRVCGGIQAWALDPGSLLFLLPMGLKPSFEGDFFPHFFFPGRGMVVFSTSRSLGAKVLAAWKRGTQTEALFREMDGLEGEVEMSFLLKGSYLREWGEGAPRMKRFLLGREWLQAGEGFKIGGGRGIGGSGIRGDSKIVERVLLEVFSLMNVFRGQSRVKGGARFSQFRMEFVKDG